MTALRGLAGEYARYALAAPHHPGHPGGVWAAWYVGWSLILLFPAPADAPAAAVSRWPAADAAIVAGIGLALPVAIGIAILKYRLYAIDRIISRTVSYALVTGLVVGVYLGCVALLTRVLPVRGSVGVAVSVLAAAALFNPLRGRVQSMVDQRFDRARYDAERVVAQFSVQLRDQVDLDVLGEDLRGRGRSRPGAGAPVVVAG